MSSIPTGGYVVNAAEADGLLLSLGRVAAGGPDLAQLWIIPVTLAEVLEGAEDARAVKAYLVLQWRTNVDTRKILPTAGLASGRHPSIFVAGGPEATMAAFNARFAHPDDARDAAQLCTRFHTGHGVLGAAHRDDSSGVLRCERK